MNGTVDIQQLLPWVKQSLADNTCRLGQGYQGQTLLYKQDGVQIVIKTPHGRGLIKYFHIRMLRHEHEVYLLLQDVAAVPKCYGLIDNTYLAIEYIEAKTIRQDRPVNDSPYYQQLLSTIKQLHARNVAHMDLKKKENLLVNNQEQPVVIDFGAAVIYKPGFHPFNHYLYRLAKRFDFNAWIKHKYMRRLHEISENDLQYFDRTITERIASKIKKHYRWMKKGIANSRSKN